ncbi:hypothetical protein TDSAC_1702 [Thermodesulfobium acidiphilum]|uniref:Uncharacterized protein n=1 Tax=Thermodesulfobium acidiphilum TaxID=1794699 RepID=A0A2R4W2U8_THEAF|nr:hypothetical protein [Thermodesulfobium acidiphilum]AWB11038.1 hypothetical protein TDSAC_1702 [Thermodesulfobium acidiphilum]
MNPYKFFEKPESLKITLIVLFSFLTVVTILDLIVPKKAEYGFEEFPSFFSVYGFVACVVLVLAAKYILRPIVKRKEDYYDN